MEGVKWINKVNNNEGLKKSQGEENTPTGYKKGKSELDCTHPEGE